MLKSPINIFLALFFFFLVPSISLASEYHSRFEGVFFVEFKLPDSRKYCDFEIKNYRESYDSYDCNLSFNRDEAMTWIEENVPCSGDFYHSLNSSKFKSEDSFVVFAHLFCKTEVEFSTLVTKLEELALTIERKTGFVAFQSSKNDFSEIVQCNCHFVQLN